MSCLVCHGIERATRDGNGSWTLRRRRIFLPDPDNEASVERHRDEARPLAGVDLCGSCHRGVLSEATGNPAALTGMDDLAGWGESRFAGTRLDRIDLGQGERKSCRDCHMPAEDGLASHRFPGGHTWLAAQRAHPGHRTPGGARRPGCTVRGCACRWSTIRSVANWSGKMSVHERTDIDSQRTEQVTGLEQGAGARLASTHGGRGTRGERTPCVALTRGLP